MNLAIGLFSVACVLLLVGGTAKAARPNDTAHALHLVGAPVPAAVVRVGGALEAALGGWALLAANRASALLVGASYVAFFVFVAVAKVRRLPIASCGCFGRLDTPPSVVHLAIDLAAVVAAVMVAIDPGDGIRRVLETQPASGVPYAVLLVVGTVATLAALTALPRALGEHART